MSKASDKILGDLHGKLAKSMLSALESSDTAQDLLAAYADELPTDVTQFLTRLSTSNPALLTAVSKFLKDNDITCSIETSSELSELEVRLANKRKRVGNVIPIHDE